MIGIEYTQILPSDKAMPGQLYQIIAIDVNLRCIHRDVVRDVRVPSCRTLDNVRRPAVIVIAGAVIWARHLAVTCIKLAAMAQGEAVGVVAAQEMLRFGLDQWNVGTFPIVHQLTVHCLDVIDRWVLAGCHVVDLLQPVYITIAHKRISSDVKLRYLFILRHGLQSKRLNV
uniref:Uncharacterized protein n=1 Tax=Anopheles christyi TaxID=43041 RepID=A0A182KHR1_9DIPT